MDQEYGGDSNDGDNDGSDVVEEKYCGVGSKLVAEEVTEGEADGGLPNGIEWERDIAGVVATEEANGVFSDEEKYGDDECVGNGGK